MGLLSLTVHNKEIVVIGQTAVTFWGAPGYNLQKFKIGIDAPRSENIMRNDLVVDMILNNGWRDAGFNNMGERIYRHKDSGEILNGLQIIVSLVRQD